MPATAHGFDAPVMVIPCSGDKLPEAAPARQLYTGQFFASALAAAEAEVAGTEGRVLVLSALHGLVELDEVIAPYEQRMDRAGAITPAELAEQIVRTGLVVDADDLYALLPAAYLACLDAALELLDFMPATPVYEAAPGIGYQRQANRCIREFAA